MAYQQHLQQNNFFSLKTGCDIFITVGFLKEFLYFCRIYKLTITNQQHDKLKEILDSFENNQDQYKYDIIGLLLKYFYIPLKRDKYYVCSQFVAEVLKDAEIYQFNKPISLIRPKDFEKISISEEVYSGFLLEAKKVV